MNTKRMSILVLALVAGTSLFAGEPAEPESGKVRVLPGNRRAIEGIVRLPIEIDVTNVVVRNMPAVLGGYVVRVEFDPHEVRLMRVLGGATPQFASAPTATDTKKANADGRLKLAAAQPDLYAPVGKVSVANLVFRELHAEGAKSIKVVVESAASAPVFDQAGVLQMLSLPVEEEK